MSTFSGDFLREQGAEYAEEFITYYIRPSEDEEVNEHEDFITYEEWVSAYQPDCTSDADAESHTDD